ncbi:MAG: hypothetical protein ACJA2G_001904, partial [Cognaticolwellia sp.]
NQKIFNKRVIIAYVTITLQDAEFNT